MVFSIKENLSKMLNISDFVFFYLFRVNKWIENLSSFLLVGSVFGSFIEVVYGLFDCVFY